MQVINVDRKLKSLTMEEGREKITIHNNRIIMKCGYLSPVQLKQVFKTYNSIFNN